ncbi:endoribonuclease Dicer homolog 3a isoform X2 [Telopea speciosissima]|uniref:endoribonuclease Dicer homolog 3a isoform X2 n=1 Tax=Telopea speciosissima TaxID=54955 RepID=UPI001CC4DCFA|nr:endoribonuclease Dicer homolog 3a isoform X2 [Telopea speciosissima]
MASSTELNPLKRSFEQLTESESKMSPGDECEVTEANGLIPKEFNARSYQKKVFQVALRKNTIAMLETGAGKTMIAVMLIKEIGQAMKMNAEKKLIIFLAPTVHLVNQQFEVIKIHTNLKVEEYYGAKKIDEWSAESWEKEIRDQDVMVMTPQILLDALRKAFMTIEMVCLMIFDESHRAIGNHPYTKIMKEFYHKSGNKPKIFGMTASPVVRKGVSSSMDCEDQISELECILDSKICTIEDKAELELYVPSAKEITRYYDPISFRCEDLKAKLNSSLSKSDALLVEMQGKLPSQFKDTDEIYKKLRKRLSNHHSKILHCLDDLGLICAHEAAKVCLENVPILGTTEEELYRASFLQCKYFLEEVLRIIEECLPSDYEKFLDVGTLGLEALEMGFISPKLYELIQIFQSLGGTRQILCLIFVERIITAKVIERFIKKLNYLSHFSVSYLTGGSSSVDALTPKMQKKTLDSFRRGEVNLLFATNVAEEGIDVPNCSSIIRFDLPKTVRSYVQSRGRARQPDSQYVTMLERGNIKQRDLLFEIIRSDRSVTDTTLNRDPNACISRVCCVDETSAYVVESTGASVTADSSIGLIYRYCEKLPGDKYYTPKPNFQFSLSGGSYEYTLSLPPNAAFQKVVGPANRNSHISKQLVCLEACKKLHQMGALDDHLLPYIEDPSRDAVIERTEESASGAGTTKRKELHGSARVRALSGTWGGKPDGVILQAYKVNFSCNLVGEFYSGFVLLIDSKLDDEVANAEVELYLIPDKLVKSSVFPCGEVHLDAEQVKKSMCFQGFFFNGLFLTSKKRKEYLIKTENKSLWCSSNMYLLLPLELPDPASHESVRINWRAIDGCASVVNFLKEKSNFSADHSFISEKGDSLFSSTSLSDTECKSSEVVHLANVSVNFNDLVNMVVVAVHTGRIYSVLDVMIGTSAESPFDLTSDAVPSNYSSFREYFNKKYGILLMHPGQPLLLLKQSHNAHNLLLAKPNEGGSLCKETPEAGGVVEKPQNHVHMPPELLVSIGVSINVLKTFYLLPSLMHRLESLMLACQLREEIACHPNDSPISSSLILEALTTLRCCEKFSLERLELLGDSVLKYAVSCHLFLRYPKKHEGQLSARRSWAVCNSTLHKLGTNRKIQGYIRDSAFDPRRWVAPGQLTSHPVCCKCLVDTNEVPLGRKFITEDTSVVVGKICDKGHRWMCSKTIADCVEALIGAYYVGGGLSAALLIMKWFGIDVEFEPRLIEEAINSASVWSYTPNVNELEMLESKLGYRFSVKGLLLEAITHASLQELGVGYCYQRLEYLGDSVLDLLITWYLYQNHTEIDPGELTDLRSASVNNENFARVAVKHNLQQHLQHGSGVLLGQITEYVKSVSQTHDNTRSLQGTKGPKVLGDMVESIAGAILIDTKLNLDEVWRIFRPLLSPIVTPDKLELPPLRQLHELCDHLGYFIKEMCVTKGDVVHAELRLQLKDVLLKGEGCERNRKAAKGRAALHLLKDLEERGVSHSLYVSKQKKLEPADGSSFMDMAVYHHLQPNDEAVVGPVTHKKLKTIEDMLPVEPPANNSLLEDGFEKVCDPKLASPVSVSINLQKGGPRSSLYQLCRMLQWPMPTFHSVEHKSRVPIEFGEGSERRTGFSSFISKISLHIPNNGVIELTGDQKADKKSSFDSAALLMLYELGRQGRCVIGD